MKIYGTLNFKPRKIFGTLAIRGSRKKSKLFMAECRWLSTKKKKRIVQATFLAEQKNVNVICTLKPSIVMT